MSLAGFLTDLQRFVETLPLPPGFDQAAAGTIPVSDEIVQAIRRYLQERTADAVADAAAGLEDHITWAYTQGAAAAFKQSGIRILGSRVPTDGLQAVLQETRPILQETFGGMTTGLMKTLRTGQEAGESYDQIKRRLTEQLASYQKDGIPFRRKGQYKRFIEVTATGKLKESKRRITKNVTITPKNYADILTKTTAKRAYARGHIAGYASAGVPAWRYQAVGDERTRVRHLALHGRVFRVGSPEEALAIEIMGEPRCRCRPVPYFGDPTLDEPEEAYRQERQRWAKEALDGVDPESKTGKMLKTIAGGRQIKPPAIPAFDPFGTAKPRAAPRPRPAAKPEPKTPPAVPPTTPTRQAWEPYLKKEIAARTEEVAPLLQHARYRNDPRRVVTRTLYGRDLSSAEVRDKGEALLKEGLFEISGPEADKYAIRELIRNQLPALVHEDVIRKAGPVKIILSPTRVRASYRTGARAIIMSRGSTNMYRTLLHEYGHHIEGHTAQTAHNAFLAVRAQKNGNKLRKMSDIRPNEGYGDSETSFAGFDHIHPYAGKPYWNGSPASALRRFQDGDLPASRGGEIISMGLESLRTGTDAADLLAKDPEYFMFLLTVFRGLA